MNGLSLNQATVQRCGVAEAVSACIRAGIGGIGLWREHVADFGLAATAKLVRSEGLAVTSLCRGGFFTDPDPQARARSLADNRRAIEEAAELGTGELVLVSGGLRGGDVDSARSRVADAIAELAPYAREHQVRLAIEPLHPMFCSDRCVISTVDQALDIAEHFPADQVGVVIDAYHVWWDPRVYDAIERAGSRIAAFQVSDWTTPLPHGVLLGRSMMGDGCIELRRLHEAVREAGYTGPVEVEIFNEEIWSAPADGVVEKVVARCQEHVW